MRQKSGNKNGYEVSITNYGGTIAAPVMAEIYENILPYLGIEADYSEEKIKETMSGIYIEEGDWVEIVLRK